MMKMIKGFISLFILIGFLVVFLEFNISKAHSQTIEPSYEEEIKALCVLGQKVDNFPFYVYKDGRADENNFFPTGNMGDFLSSWINTYCSEAPFSGSSCVKIEYEVRPRQPYGWAGLYWQYPPNNWGDIPKAYDLSKASKLTFWARGEDGQEVINKFQVGGISGKYRDSGVASIGPITLSKEWRKYTIYLSKMDNSIIISKEDKECWPFMEPLSRVVGGFSWATSMQANRNNGITFYLDEIRFEND